MKQGIQWRDDFSTSSETRRPVTQKRDGPSNRKLHFGKATIAALAQLFRMLTLPLPIVLFSNLALAVPNEASADEGKLDRIVLKNGKVYEGEIIEYSDNAHIVIKLDDGRKPVILWSDIKEIESSKHRPKKIRTPNGDAADAGRDRRSTETSVDDIGYRDERTKLSARGAEIEVELRDAEAKRLAWIARGGTLPTFSVQATFTGIIFPLKQLPPSGVCYDSSGFPQLSTATSAGTAVDYGLGGGAAIRAGVMHLALPKDGGGTWWAFRLGSGVDLALSSYQTFSSDPAPRCGTTANLVATSSQTTLIQLPANVGFHVGLGSGGKTDWRGLVLGAAWAPSYSYYVPSQGEGQGSFSAAGFEVTVDYATLQAALNSLANKAHFRLTAFILPPMQDGWPFVATLGLGAVWY